MVLHSENVLKITRERFDMYLLAANTTDAKQKRALLLYVAGPAVHKIFNTLTDTGIQ
jgi:hypothetical protein